MFSGLMSENIVIGISGLVDLTDLIESYTSDRYFSPLTAYIIPISSIFGFLADVPIISLLFTPVVLASNAGLKLLFHGW